MKLVIIGNYPRDRQQSMERFAQMLREGTDAQGIPASILRPKVTLGRPFCHTISGIAKWLGYIDKWILFPVILLGYRVVLGVSGRLPERRFHIADHSNAFYLRFLPKKQTAITCHDVLAILGALGDEAAHCPATRTGVLLQKWILANLVTARRLAAVSQTTLNQLEALEQTVSHRKAKKREWRVILNGFNGNFAPATGPEATRTLRAFGLEAERYLLHVGSALPRKNRRMLLEMVENSEWHGKICFAGEPIDKDLHSTAVRLGLEDRVVSVQMPAHPILLALYSGSYAFIFPSFSEGFGWPLIEAQACGTPVVASNLQPMLEVSGGTALHADPYDPGSFGKALAVLQTSERRSEIVEAGFRNCRRFESSKMIQGYHQLWELAGRPHA